jgi:mono/diheme cytochrome c family protein/glucose/arabinose dehydrogenase
MIKACALAVFMLLATGAALEQTPSPPRPDSPLPQALQPVALPTPALSPADSIKAFVLQPGYRVELVASEPMIQDPVAIDFDPDGRLWVIEMIGYMNSIVAANEHEPLGRIAVLEDTNNDGLMDKRTIFADGLVLPRALKVLAHGVLVGEPPNLWLMRDTNGDLKADTRELVTDKYGRLDANVEHNANSLTWALDNWMYTSEIDMSLRLKHGKFEVVKTPARGQWGNSQDDAGRIYRNTNESVLHVDIVPTPYYARSPNLLRTRGSYESLEGDAKEVNTVWPAHPTRGVNRGYQKGVLRADGTLATFTSVSAPLVYRGDRLPRDLYGNVFVVEPAANVVSRIVLHDDGTTIKATKAYERSEFLASTDERFRPVNLSNAPDGTLYVVDMYRGIIQHRGYITEYLRDHIMSNGLEQPVGYGRIYRIVHETTRRDGKPAMSAASSASLVQALSHPNGWRRDTAQRLLVERDDASVVPALTTLAGRAPDPRTRLHALWTLDGMDRITPALVMHALVDSSRDVRTSALRLSERWLAAGDPRMQKAVLAHLTDPDWAVRRQLAATIGILKGDARDAAVLSLLDRNGDDPIVVDAALSGIAGSEAAILDRLSASQAESAQRSSAIAVLTATIVRGRQDALSQRIFDRIADSARPEWQRASMMTGAEAAVLDTALPGSAASGRGAGAGVASCPTCPGARTGPGGASAFPSSNGRAAATTGSASTGRGAEPRSATPGARGRGAPAIALSLSREPALARVAAEGGDLGRRASAVLERVGWPGKPGMATAAAPLTPAEQQRFDAGQEIYKTICEACHQPDGRGREKLAPSLVGSELALGPDGIPARILINGKEGSVGLMPPLGAGMTDEQIAAVLTYVRRAWGQGASPVTPASAGAVRAQVVGRTRPWTNEELQKIISAGGQ